MGLKVLNRLSVRLTAAFLLAATLGVALVAVLTYRTTSSDFNVFISHIEAMQDMMGGMMGGAVNEAALEFIKNLGRTLWFVGLLGVSLALLLGWLLTRQIVAPLGEITTAVHHVAKGDLSHKVKVRGSNELTDLGESFNKMAETLNRDRELRQNMVADIAHELSTPLSVLQANIEAMQDGVIEASPENLASLHQETYMLGRLIDDLRMLSLVESGQLEFHPGVTALEKLSARVIEGMQPGFASKNVELALEAADTGLQLLVDSDRIEQVIRNLLSNAYQYTPEGGRVTLEITTDSEGVVVSVSDTGEGIAAEDLPHVFERFYRVDRSRTRRTGGSGLGLAIVKQLVEAQGGQVWATSQVTKGSVFSFRFPAGMLVS
ncbi:MAG: ATP-binding protein [Dehalococcoidales bacterium]|nr:ATP-binding protein [Dehalococcoidales bacterium]